MKLPGRSELSNEQERIYLEAPLNGATLISGPPGTGKSVLAIMRAFILGKQKLDFSLVMYNKVLESYTKAALKPAGLDHHVKTWHSWIFHWWRDATGYQLPSTQRFAYDFDTAVENIIGDQIRHSERLNWGHLLIDEGQDFPPGFYFLIGFLMRTGKFDGKRAPAITVMADEHQRLEEQRHSRISDIFNNLALNDERHYRLSTNFRNTFEIAALARCFFTGNPNELPSLPETRRGKKPEIRSFKTLAEEARFIAKYAKNNDDQDIGIFVPKERDQRKMHELLEGPILGTGLNLQMYSSRNREWKDAARLEFGTKGSITLLTDKSCKGLEFDAVFIPQLNRYKVSGVEEEFVKMKLYVMASRARSYLAFSYSESINKPEILKLMPGEDKELIKWKNQ